MQQNRCPVTVPVVDGVPVIATTSSNYDQVVVGPGGNLVVRVDRTTWDVFMIVAIVLGILILILIIVLGVYTAHDHQRNNPPADVYRGHPGTRNGNGNNISTDASVRNSDPGAASNGTSLPGCSQLSQTQCLAGQHNWDQTNNKCIYTPPYWGATGQREAHSDQYYGLGTVPLVNGMPAIGAAELSILRVVPADQLSFANSPGVACTQLCDQTAGCQGVLWSRSSQINGVSPMTAATQPSNPMSPMSVTPPQAVKDQYPKPQLYPGAQTVTAIPSAQNLTYQPSLMGNQCHLLTQATIAGGQGLSYNLAQDGNLYLKRGTRPKVTDRVYLYTNKLPMRFWLDGEQGKNEEYVTLQPRQVHSISFQPTQIINDSMLTGLYSTEPFTPEMIPSHLNDYTNTKFYVHQPNQPLQLPASWKYRTIWVAYF
jgi:hypothetical protein